MNFKWNARLRSTAGACFNKRTVKINENLDCERVSRIELSSKVSYFSSLTFFASPRYLMILDDQIG